MGDSTYVQVVSGLLLLSNVLQRAWWISDRPRSTSPKEGHTPFHRYHNISAGIANDTSTLPINMTFVEWTMSRPFWRAISADIFAGQIIATLIVLTFVAVFLLREWISQNARPGVFEDDEFFVENRELPPLEPVPQPAAQPQAQPQLLPLAAPPNGAPVAPASTPVVPPLANRGRGARRTRRHRVNRSFKAADMAVRRRSDKGKGKARDDDESAPESDADRRSAARARVRRRLYSGSEESSDESEEEMEFSHNLRDVVAAAAMHRAEAALAARNSPAAPNTDEVDKFEFTFRASTQLSRNPRSISEPRSPSVWSSEANLSPGGTDDGSISASLTRGENIDPVSPSSSTDTLSSTASPQSGIPSLSPSVAEKIFASTPSAPSSPVRRPPMPSTRLPTLKGAGPSTPPLVVGPARSGARTPLASPSLATYRAPEELGAGPSTLAGYFGQEGLTEEEKREQDMYFRAPDEEAEPPQHGDVPALQQTSDSGEGEEGDDYDEDEDDDYEHVLADDEEDDEDDDEGADEVDALDFNEEADWDDEEDHEEEDGEGDQRRVDPGVQQQLVPGPLPEAPDVNDDLEGNVEDDMEGAMEAIGMRGPIYGVIQNVSICFYLHLLLSNAHVLSRRPSWSLSLIPPLALVCGFPSPLVNRQLYSLYVVQPSYNTLDSN